MVGSVPKRIMTLLSTTLCLDVCLVCLIYSLVPLLQPIFLLYLYHGHGWLRFQENDGVARFGIDNYTKDGSKARVFLPRCIKFVNQIPIQLSTIYNKNAKHLGESALMRFLVFYHLFTLWLDVCLVMSALCIARLIRFNHLDYSCLIILV